MESTIGLFMRADRDLVYRLASRVEAWPEILPHYRWVRVLREDGPDQRTVAMSAVRDVIPVRWVARQTLFPHERRIDFLHVGGITRGMEVTWTLTPTADGTDVSIWHGFHPSWPVPDALVERIVGEFFVGNIAGKTLRQIKLLAEAESRR